MFTNPERQKELSQQKMANFEEQQLYTGRVSQPLGISNFFMSSA